MAALLLNADGDPTGAATKAEGPAREAEKPVDEFFVERALALLLIATLAFWLRARDSGFTTAYMDESIYVVYGRMFLARHFEAPLDSPLRWSFGWYLWPVLAALADRLGGLVAVREFSAVLGTATVMAVYGFARRLFDATVALGSALVFAVIAPAVMASRIATRDSGTLFFFTLGLWAFACAWQTNRRRCWLAAFACLLGAFLCKYIVAIYLPILFLLALRKGWRAALCFCLPLAVAVTAYVVLYRADLSYLLFYGHKYSSLRASGAQLWDIYVLRRLELWLIAALALVVFALPRKAVTALLWLGAALVFAFQWKTRADFDFWKHAAYPLIFLTPLAVRTIFAASKRLGRSPEMQIGICITALASLCGSAVWTGHSLEYDRTVFWPNVEAPLSYFETRLGGRERVLTDDSVFRYYLHPRLSQSQIVDPFYFHYKQWEGEPAFRAAADDGWFDYIVLDGGIGAEAQALQRAVQGHLQNYTTCLEMPDPTLGHTIRILQRSACSPAPQALPAIEILSPREDAPVERVSVVSGRVSGAAADWYVVPEVFSNRWYPLEPVKLEADGSFHTSAVFAGESEQGCHQMLRVRLYDERHHARAVSVLFNLKTKGKCTQ